MLCMFGWYWSGSVSKTHAEPITTYPVFQVHFPNDCIWPKIDLSLADSLDRLSHSLLAKTACKPLGRNRFKHASLGVGESGGVTESETVTMSERGHHLTRLINWSMIEYLQSPLTVLTLAWNVPPTIVFIGILPDRSGPWPQLAIVQVLNSLELGPGRGLSRLIDI